MSMAVYQHWDPLKVCIVGRSYPPEFYSWIQNQKTRQRFEKLAEETEQDYQNLIQLLENKFGVTVARPQLPTDLQDLLVGGRWVPPPTAPRDYFLMIHDRLWVPRVPNVSHAWKNFYQQHQQHDWPFFDRLSDFKNAMPAHADALVHNFQRFCFVDQQHHDQTLRFYYDIFQVVESSGTEIVRTNLDFINGCLVSRLGDHLFFATQSHDEDRQAMLDKVNVLFPKTQNRVVNAGGYGDAVYCPVCPGLIISLSDISTYQDTFPDWEVVYLPPSQYEYMREFEASMKLNKGRWFIPGFEHDNELCQIFEHYFDHWVGQVGETVFDVNILVVDTKNIVVSCHNQQVEDACSRYGIEVHVSPFRHKYFWDCGVHRITNDLERRGHQQRWF